MCNERTGKPSNHRVEVKALDYEGLYETYYMQVYSFLVTLSRDRSLAEELTAQTFYKAMTARSEYRGEGSELTWLCAIAKNLYADEQRRRARQSGQEPDETVVPAPGAMEEDAQDRDAAFRIHLILHDLPEPYKEVFQLRVFGELAFVQIGRIFGKTETWARVTYHRARLKIQERMGEDDG